MDRVIYGEQEYKQYKKNGYKLNIPENVDLAIEQSLERFIYCACNNCSDNNCNKCIPCSICNSAYFQVGCVNYENNRR